MVPPGLSSTHPFSFLLRWTTDVPCSTLSRISTLASRTRKESVNVFSTV